MKTWQIKLIPLSSLYQDFPSSDTLFGAICWGIKRIYGEKKLIDLLTNLQNRPYFILSSSFPYLEVKESVLSFYPKPISADLSPKDITEIADGNKKVKVKIITEYKKFKKANYVSSSIFKKYVKGLSEKSLFNDYWNGNVKLRGRLLLTEDEFKKFFKNSNPLYILQSVQKNSLDRLTVSTTGEGQTFYQQEYFISSPFKLHFLIKTEDIEFFKPVFRYIEDEGMGGNRSTGKGRFKIIIADTISLGDETSKKFITLSRYIPDFKEVSPIFYEILPYRSKIDSRAEFKGEDIWKSKIMYVKEGSCFECRDRREFYGISPVVKVIGEYKIYQNGLAFPVFGNFGG